MSERVAFRKSDAGPCVDCPFLSSNRGRRHAGGWYSLRNIRRLWAGLRRGHRMTCHPTDPAMNDLPESPGLVPNGTVTRDCAGALILVQREMSRLQDVIGAGGGLADYWATNPRGLTWTGAAIWFMDCQWGGVVPGVLAVGRPNLNDSRVAHPDLTPWEPVR